MTAVFARADILASLILLGVFGVFWLVETVRERRPEGGTMARPPTEGNAE